ncbi:unnamed protein product [Kuraishia capsulata CBS 1993]|uniref:Tricalbin n=1 Tax=Kuraishia capsulata CBS 1993 TaxID=1382522 RepID=W6MHD0_9ASCO|nr:uncharacterized protein KUCA_T00001345001 [Kuraishia capsulata CBS 1993]CDK25376.1 unnamed protein product [Kuraishia capsulata CBS 1993]
MSLALDFKWQEVGFFNDTNVKKTLTPRDSDSSTFLQQQTAFLQRYIMDKYYSDLYWNTSLVIGTCFFAWFAARFGGGILALVFVLFGASSVYRAEFRRFNRNLRDDMARIGAADRLENTIETMDWMNDFLAKFWVIYMPALSEMVLQQAHEALKDAAPGFGIDELSLDEFTLGSKAPKVESIKSYTKLGKDIVQMDWAFGFAPNDTDDMTKNEIKKKVDPKVALGVRIGKGFVSKSLPILVEDMSFTGRMRITLRFGQNFPHVKSVSVMFLEPPSIDYALKPVGGDTLGLDIMSFVPGLSSFVNGLIHSTLRPMLYAPNSLDIDVEEIMAANAPTAIGCVALTVKYAEDLKTKDECNPYISFFTDDAPSKIHKTDVKAKTSSPCFNEVKYLIINNMQQKLNIEAQDFNDGDDKLIGSADFELADLLQKDVITNKTINLTKSSRKVGRLTCDLRWFPVLEGATLEDGSKSAAPDSESGILKIVLHEGKNFDPSYSPFGKISAYVQVYLNGELMLTTRASKETNEPKFGETLEHLVATKSLAEVKLVVRDGSAFGEPVIGKWEGSISDLVFIDTVKFAPFGTLRVDSQWKPLGITADVATASFFAPIGVARLHIRRADDLRNLETIGKVDPYFRLFISGHLKYKSVVHPSSLNPTFEDLIYIPIFSQSQTASLEVMDKETTGKDRSLGSASIDFSPYLKKSGSGNFLAYEGSKTEQHVTLSLPNKGPKGKVFYSVSFYPSLPSMTIKEVETANEKAREAREKELEEEKAQQEMAEDFKKNPKKYEWYVPEEDEEETRKPTKLQLSPSELLSYNSGTLGITVMGGQFTSPDLYVSCVLDEQPFPSYISPRATGRRMASTDVGEAFVRDLQNAVLIVRLTKKAIAETEKDILSEESFNLLDLLKKNYGSSFTLNVGGSHVKFVFEYVPSAVKLPVSETMLDTGVLHLEILDAADLKAADSNGKSDPVLKILVNGTEAYETKVVKKTLSPTWNESVDIPVPSRARSSVIAAVFDWDFAGENDFLGEARLNLEALAPGKSQVFKANLNTQGSVRFNAVFTPKYIRPKIGASSGLDLGSVAGAPVKLVAGATGAVGGVVGGAAGAIGSSGGGLVKGLFKSKHQKKVDEFDDTPTLGAGSADNSFDAPPIPLGMQDVSSIRSGATSGTRINGHSRSASQYSHGSYASSFTGADVIPGRLSILTGIGITSRSHVLVQVSIEASKLKDIYKTRAVRNSSGGPFVWHESSSFKAPPTAKVIFSLKESHTFGKSTTLGSGEVYLKDISGKTEEIKVPISNEIGDIVVTFNYGSRQ